MVTLPLIHHQLQLLLLHQDYPHHHLFFAAAEMKVVTPCIWFPHQCLLNSWYHSELSQQSWLNTWSSMFSSIQNRSFKNLLHSTETKINSSQMDHKHVTWTVSYFFPHTFSFSFSFSLPLSDCFSFSFSLFADSSLFFLSELSALLDELSLLLEESP